MANDVRRQGLLIAACRHRATQTKSPSCCATVRCQLQAVKAELARTQYQLQEALRDRVLFASVATQTEDPDACSSRASPGAGTRQTSTQKDPSLLMDLFSNTDKGEDVQIGTSELTVDQPTLSSEPHASSYKKQCWPAVDSQLLHLLQTAGSEVLSPSEGKEGEDEIVIVEVSDAEEKSTQPARQAQQATNHVVPESTSSPNEAIYEAPVGKVEINLCEFEVCEVLPDGLLSSAKLFENCMQLPPWLQLDTSALKKSPSFAVEEDSDEYIDIFGDGNEEEETEDSYCWRTEVNGVACGTDIDMATIPTGISEPEIKLEQESSEGEPEDFDWPTGPVNSNGNFDPVDSGTTNGQQIEGSFLQCRQSLQPLGVFRKHSVAQLPGTQMHCCTYCTNSFSSASGLRRHFRLVHLKERRFACRWCSRLFAEKRDQRVHEWKSCPVHSVAHVQPLKQENNAPGSRLCNFCGSVFSSVQTAKRHYYDLHLREEMQ